MIQNLTVEDAHKKIIGTIRSFFKKAGATSAVIGLSGGIDSAVVMALAAEALGKDNVHGILMPSQFSTLHSIADAVALAENIGCSYNMVSIEPIFNRYQKELSVIFEGTEPDVTEENLQARIRGTILMAYSNKFKSLLLNTSNKSELSVGYGTLYGDLSGAMMVIADLYKVEVYELARYINRERTIIPESSITKAPSAELRNGQKDTDSLPDYAVMDPILYAMNELGKSESDLKLEYDEKTVERVARLRKGASFKVHQIPPILKVGDKPLAYPQKWIEE